jgi:hypothetical protein
LRVRSGVKGISMKYAAWFAAKLAIAAVLLGLVWRLVEALLPPAPGGLLANLPRLGIDLPYTLGVGFIVVLGWALLKIALHDQQYRCRICLRKLRMPQAEGRLSYVWLLGNPYTEYICTFGHGKLYVPDVHLASTGKPRWVGSEDLWADLLAAEEMATSGKDREPPI